MSKNVEIKDFQAETKRLLELMIDSIYTNKEIFLRELISNSSDALDKMRLLSLTDSDLLGDNYEFKITIRTDRNNNKLSISDNGVGMTYDEVIENIGTIAKSGSKAFLEKLKNDETAKESLELIGQFGIGFYSSFMVAQRIEVVSHVAGEESGVRWCSAGDGKYTIEHIDQGERGTTVNLTIKKAFRDKSKHAQDFLNAYTIQNLVKKYSDYIRYPVRIDFIKEEKPKDKDGNVIESVQTETIIETRTVNSMQPIWERAAKELKFDDYFQFYKETFHDYSEPLDVMHAKAEGRLEFTMLLFIPSHAPSDFYSPTRSQKAGGLW